MQASQERGLENLQVWHKAVNYAIRVCQEIVPIFPEEEKWALASQLRRSVQSIPTNIAEGYGRYYYQDTIRFCYIAHGSLEESFSQLTVAHRLGYIPDSLLESLTEAVVELRRMLSGYVGYLKKTRRGEEEPGSPHKTREPDALYVEAIPGMMDIRGEQFYP